MKTFMANPAKIDRKWYVVDAEGKTLGRLASEVAKVLRGKNKPEYTPHAVSYTHLRAHETRHDLVCRLLLEKKKKKDHIQTSSGTKKGRERYKL